MSRIPNEGLKPYLFRGPSGCEASLNEQNPERGIETAPAQLETYEARGLNEQNPERGIETCISLSHSCNRIESE